MIWCGVVIPVAHRKVHNGVCHLIVDVCMISRVQ